MEQVRYLNYHRGVFVECFTDGYCYLENNTIGILSAIGNDSKVKAITSALVSGKEIAILSNQYTIYLRANNKNKYRIFSSKLKSGALHQLLMCRNFLNSEDDRKMLYIGNHDESKVILRNIHQSYAVPLIPSWRKWIYQKLKENDYLIEMSGTIKAVVLDITENELDQIVSQGIQSGEICIEGEGNGCSTG